MDGFVEEEEEEVKDLEIPYLQSNALASESCSICLDLVIDQADRSVAKLQCGHQFHLDCIGSAFNAKGAMQCPNCRKIEKGQWLYANGRRPSADLDIDGWMTEDFYDLSYPELPFALQWCPFRGFTQLATFFEERELQPNSYEEPMDITVFGDYSSGSSNANGWRPYLALHGFQNAMHSAPLSSGDSVLDNGIFHRHTTSLGGQASADMMMNSYGSSTELNHEWLQRSSFQYPLNADQLASQSRERISRNETSSQQRTGSFVHTHPLLPGSVSHGLSAVGASVTGEVSGPRRGHADRNMYQQSVPSSFTPRNHLLPSVRRTRLGGLTSGAAATPSSVVGGAGGFYGFSASGSVNRNHQDGENVSRHIDRIYGWDREGLRPLPWIPLEGESQLWSPFNPNLNPTSFPQRSAVDRITQNHLENDYQRMPLPPRMPPFI